MSIFGRQVLPVGRRLELEPSPVALGRLGLWVVKRLTPEAEVWVVIAHAAAHLAPAPLAPFDAGLVAVAA